MTVEATHTAARRVQFASMLASIHRYMTSLIVLKIARGATYGRGLNQDVGLLPLTYFGRLLVQGSPLNASRSRVAEHAHHQLSYTTWLH